ncbi:MAG: PKD domain-containing protein [Candidatus Hadarchaeales archaeon]
MSIVIGVSIGIVLAFFGPTFSTNRAPQIQSVQAPPDNRAQAGTPVTIGVKAIDFDGDTLSYTWSCSQDPQISSNTENTLVWTPPSAGVYNITVTVRDGKGGQVTSSFRITVSTSEKPPEARISGPSTAMVGEEVFFSGENSNDEDGSIVGYSWNFGDGTTGSGREVTHTYSAPGSYSVVLTVIDNSGLMDNAIKRITISSLPTYSVEDMFIPSGWMGVIGDIQYDPSSTDNPHSGDTCIKIVYTPSGTSVWSGIYWQYPEGNWGDYAGQDLTGTTKLTFWARGKNGGEKAEFKVGGIRETGKEYSDSIYPAVSTGVIVLSDNWRQYTINLSGKDLSNVIGGFCWVTNSTSNPGGATIYLDDIFYEP